METRQVVLRERCDCSGAVMRRRRFLLGAAATRELGVVQPARATRSMAVCGLLVALTVLCPMHTVYGQVQWSGNGHFYLPVNTPNGVTWDEAQAAATAQGGYLATIGSADENLFVFGLIDFDEYWEPEGGGGRPLGPWLGALQPPGSPEPAGGWGWVTGEPWDYINWIPGEPNNFWNGTEDRVHFIDRAPGWNDYPANGSPLLDPIRGYVIEFDHDPNATGACVSQTLTAAEDAASGDYFGYSTAMSGDFIVVGSVQNDNVGGTDAGAAYVFRRAGGTWIKESKLIASDGTQFDRFGTSVAIDGDLIIVGTPAIDRDEGGSGNGAAYVFRRMPCGIWTEEAKLTAVDAVHGDQFGRSVSINGDVAVVGATVKDYPRTYIGRAAYVFRRVGNNWQPEAILTPPITATDDSFGWSVSISGDLIAVGAPSARSSNTGPPTGAGAVYVFRFNGSAWNQEQKLVALDPSINAEFGFSLSIAADLVVIGSAADDGVCPGVPQCDSGSAYVFRFNAGTWTQEQKLTALDAAQNTQFGFDVDGTGDVLVVGSRGADVGGIASGAGYVFYRQANIWIEVAKISAPVGASTDYFGYSVSTDGNLATVGAPLHDAACPGNSDCNAGAAFVFNVADCNNNGLPDACEVTVCPVCGDGLLEGEECDDGDACTQTDTCQGGSCVGNNPVVCTALDQCHDAGICDPAMGMCCSGPPSLNGTTCDDRDACTTDDTCSAGACVGGPPLDCDDDNVCTDDSCDPATGCVHVAITACMHGACCDEDAFGGCTITTANECGCKKCVWHELQTCEDIECLHNSIPTVSQWGLVVLTLLLLIGAKIHFARHQTATGQ